MPCLVPFAAPLDIPLGDFGQRFFTDVLLESEEHLSITGRSDFLQERFDEKRIKSLAKFPDCD